MDKSFHFRPKVTVSPKRCKIEPRLLLITNRKSHTPVRFVLKLMALDDPQRPAPKSIPGDQMSENIRFVYIFAGVLWKGSMKRH